MGEVSTTCVTCGVMGVGGNKGAVALSFTLMRRRVMVVASHFAAHQVRPPPSPPAATPLDRSHRAVCAKPLREAARKPCRRGSQLARAGAGWPAGLEVCTAAMPPLPRAPRAQGGGRLQQRCCSRPQPWRSAEPKPQSNCAQEKVASRNADYAKIVRTLRFHNTPASTPAGSGDGAGAGGAGGDGGDGGGGGCGEGVG